MNIVPANVLAYFQPIFAIDTGETHAFEVLGRYQTAGGVISLGPFFEDKNTTGADALTVDRIVRRDALRRYAAAGSEEFLFINLRLGWLAQFADRPEEMPTLKWAQEFGVNPRKLVIEITEEEFNADIREFSAVLAYYKHLGCRVAIDDYGKEASNLDRLARLEPSYLKINMDYIHRCGNLYYREYLRSLISFAKQVGIEVICEGVETEKQLAACIAAGGRYHQGYLLARPQPELRRDAVNKEIFRGVFDRTIEDLHGTVTMRNVLRRDWEQRLQTYLATRTFAARDDADAYLGALCREMIADIRHVKRMYICDRRGKQLSSNFENHRGTVTALDYRARNWAWRGYFQDFTEIYAAGGRNHITGFYIDATSQEEIYTYIHALDAETFLFIDLQNYLKWFEKNAAGKSN
ncbi:MAG: EAL domain-containing protein [Planctomycetota bacterium]|nr:EAL domain-containing protein [Planctomycetota bacterium]